MEEATRLFFKKISNKIIEGSEGISEDENEKKEMGRSIHATRTQAIT